jgi:hypothetical protein
MLGPENGDASGLDFHLEYVASRPQLLESSTPGLRSTILM